MDNVHILTWAVVACVAGLIVCSVYDLVWGKSEDLCNAKVGQIYNFEYMQPLNGTPERYRAKVIEPVCRLDDNTIARMNARSNYRRNDTNFQRTNHLVTCQMADGNIRQFYCERVVNCRRPLLAAWM